MRASRTRSRPAIKQPRRVHAAAQAPPPQSDRITVPVGTRLAEAQRALILATLKYADGDKRRTARLLGISLKTLYNRLELYRFEPAVLH